jgi:CheY-like chemotaxis protein
VAGSVEAARPLIDARGHRLHVELPPEPVVLVGDETRLAQVLQNLLGNAAKYTDEGGEIDVSLHTEAMTAVVTVADTGRGLSADAIERVFDLFVQEASNTVPTDSGLGIGLTLARRLVELHGGTIRAESPGPGQGSRFIVRLPLAPGAPATEPSAPGSSARPAAPRIAGRRVLVVDDNRDSADTMAALVRALGHEARAVYDGEAAVQAAIAFAPELVLLDLNMPGASGFAVRDQLTNLPQAPRLIAAMTGYGRHDDKHRTAEAGFDAHLTKPVDINQIATLMARLA